MEQISLSNKSIKIKKEVATKVAVIGNNGFWGNNFGVSGWGRREEIAEDEKTEVLMSKRSGEGQVVRKEVTSLSMYVWNLWCHSWAIDI